MREALIVNKQKLIELGNGELLGYRNINNDGDYRSIKGLLTDNLEVRLNYTIGPYCIVDIQNTADLYRRLIVPINLIEQVQVEEAIDLFKPVLDTYHKDRWMYDGVHLYIHYPIIEISNSIGQSHTIQDLIIRINLATDGYLSTLQGIRCSWTKEELNQNYSHSHLSIAIEVWQSFCTGSGSTFNTFLENLKKVNSTEEFELFLIQLEEYLSWESLEGKPYTSISNFYEDGVLSDSGPEGCYESTKIKLLINKTAKQWLAKICETPEVLTSIYPYLFDPSLNSIISYKQEQEVLKELYTDYTSFNEYEFIFSWDENSNRYIKSQELANIELPRVQLPQGLNVTPRLLPSVEVIKNTKIVSRFCPTLLREVIRQINFYILNGIHTTINTEGDTITT